MNQSEYLAPLIFLVNFTPLRPHTNLPRPHLTSLIHGPLFPVNYVSNDCLKAAGGKANGVLDFYQIHTYAYQGAWSSSGPFNGVSQKTPSLLENSKHSRIFNVKINSEILLLLKKLKN